MMETWLDIYGVFGRSSSGRVFHISLTSIRAASYYTSWTITFIVPFLLHTFSFRMALSSHSVLGAFATINTHQNM